MRPVNINYANTQKPGKKYFLELNAYGYNQMRLSNEVVENNLDNEF